MWVDGEIAARYGQSGGSVVSRLERDRTGCSIGRNVKPGQQIQLAVFGMNGPISEPPTNYIWLRVAKLAFQRRQRRARWPCRRRK